MDIGVFAFHFVDREGMLFDELLELARDLGLTRIELGTGGFVAQDVSRAGDLLVSPGRRDELQGQLRDHGLEISALNAIGNPFHPDTALAERCANELRETIRLAPMMGVSRVVAGGGCPGDGPRARQPNWAVYPYFLDDLWDRQWRDQVLPFWRQIGALAGEHGVSICIELHPVMAVYNVRTFEQVRDVGGEAIKVNFDPSHLFWTGMDVVAVMKRLGSTIQHVHAKDTRFEPDVMALNGFLDPTPFTEPDARSWNYCTLGDGHDASFWQSFFQELAAMGYDAAVSIEHEDVKVHGREALERNVNFLRSAFQVK